MEKDSEMKYDIDYFINKFEAIPEDQWTTKKFVEDGKCCALGHCGRGFGGIDNGEAQALIDLFNHYGFSVVSVNDGYTRRYIETNVNSTPKERILNCLKEFKAKD